jgi:hypothetical protein
MSNIYTGAAALAAGEAARRLAELKDARDISEYEKWASNNPDLDARMRQDTYKSVGKKLALSCPDIIIAANHYKFCHHLSLGFDREKYLNLRYDYFNSCASLYETGRGSRAYPSPSWCPDGSPQLFNGCMPEAGETVVQYYRRCKALAQESLLRLRTLLCWAEEFSDAFFAPSGKLADSPLFKAFCQYYLVEHDMRALPIEVASRRSLIDSKGCVYLRSESREVVRKYSFCSLKSICNNSAAGVYLPCRLSSDNLSGSRINRLKIACRLLQANQMRARFKII